MLSLGQNFTQDNKSWLKFDFKSSQVSVLKIKWDKYQFGNSRWVFHWRSADQDSKLVPGPDLQLIACLVEAKRRPFTLCIN